MTGRRRPPESRRSSDGESWSGELARSLELATSGNIPLFVVGVGTIGGARMPVVPERRIDVSLAGLKTGPVRASSLAACRGGDRLRHPNIQGGIEHFRETIGMSPYGYWRGLALFLGFPE